MKIKTAAKKELTAMQKAYLSKVNLQGADLSKADLRGIKLTVPLSGLSSVTLADLRRAMKQEKKK